MVKLVWLSSIFSVLALTAMSQKAPMKFGKIDDSDIIDKSVTEFPDASAVVLGDYGITKFKYNQLKGWQYEMERHVRIKIVSKEGYQYANAEIPFYEGANGNKESIGNFKAQTYNIIDGKIEKEKLAKDAIFEEKINENWYQLKFAFPKVVEGSVIEYSYTITSDFLYNLRSWRFQSTIPVLHSEYRLTLPEYFNYQQLFQGYESLAVSDNNNVVETFDISYSSTPGQGGKVEKGVSQLTSQSKAYRWVAVNLPAIENESFMTTYLDYVAEIGFQLISIQYPRQPLKVVMGTYEGKFNESLLEDERFGKMLGRTNFADWLPELISQAESPVDKTMAIYEYIKSYMSWNDQRRVFASKSLKGIYNDKTGSSADINLLLVALLQEAGLEAHPIVLSTRNNGKPHPIYPTMDKFNYTIGSVIIDGKIILMDATAKNLPLNVLPERALNGQGWLVSDTPQWVTLQGDSQLRTSTSMKFEFTDEGLNAVVDISHDGLTGANERNNYLIKGHDEYFEKLSTSEWSLTNSSVENEKNIYDSFKEHHELLNEEGSLETIIYINPMIFGGLKENFFKNDKRKFPVDFPAPIKEICMIEIKIPEGYAAEIPKSSSMSLPNNGGVFKYSALISSDKVIITSILDIKKTLFVGDDYLALLNFLDLVIAKHNEQVIIKKL